VSVAEFPELLIRRQPRKKGSDDIGRLCDVDNLDRASRYRLLLLLLFWTAQSPTSLGKVRP
jgi:hypothetical protein